MKPSEQRLTEARRQHIEAIVARHVRELFKRLPMLSGFCAPDRRAVRPRRSSSHAVRDSTCDLIVTQRSRRQLHARFTTRVSEGKSGEEVLA